MKMEGLDGTGDIARPATLRQEALVAIEKDCAHLRNALVVLDLPPTLEIVAGQTHRLPSLAENTSVTKTPYETLHEGVVTVGALIAGLQKGLKEPDLEKREAIRITTDVGILTPFAFGTELYINPTVEELIEVVAGNEEAGALSMEDVLRYSRAYKLRRDQLLRTGQGSPTTRH